MPPANIAAARHFLDLVTTGEAPSFAALARCLDALAMSYHDAPLGEPADSDAPASFATLGHKDIAARFPELGFYTVAFPLASAGEGLVGNAIDDLMDIGNDLSEVLWRFEHVGVDDAHWYFRFLFEAHWGRNLRELAHYLHAKQFG